MIRAIDIKNFKSLKSVNLALGHLNLLTGLNGSGKSSLLQTLLLLRQSEHEIGRGRLLLQKKERSAKNFELMAIPYAFNDETNKTWYGANLEIKF